MLSVVIPTLNAAASLAACLEILGWEEEIVIVDGGSTDTTREIAIGLGGKVLETPPGRGIQLAAGAKAAIGDWLLFLHADTVLSPDWRAAAVAHMAAHPDKAAYFRLRLDAPAPQARRIEKWVERRCRLLGLPYGDQGLLISRSLYREIGGFRPLALMEDVDITRRLGRNRLVPLDAMAVTSAERYLRDGWVLRPLRNLFCLGLWLAGVPAKQVARLYGK